MSEVLLRLDGLNLSLPPVPPARGAFRAFSRCGNLVYLAGQICEWNGEVRFLGALGDVQDLASGMRAAELCALNLLASLSQALDGDLDRVAACHRLGGFVFAVPGWPLVPRVIDGASNLMHAMFGQAGHHVRTAVGVATLPAGASVEVDAIFEVR